MRRLRSSIHSPLTPVSLDQQKVLDLPLQVSARSTPEKHAKVVGKRPPAHSATRHSAPSPLTPYPTLPLTPLRTAVHIPFFFSCSPFIFISP